MNCFLEASANTLIALNNSFHLRLRKSVYDMHNQIPLIQLLLKHLSCHMFCGKCFFAFLIAHSKIYLYPEVLKFKLLRTLVPQLMRLDV